MEIQKIKGYILLCLFCCAGLVAHAQKDLFHITEVSEIEFKTAYKYQTELVYTTDKAKLDDKKREELLAQAGQYLSEKRPEIKSNLASLGNEWLASTSCYFLPLGNDYIYWVNTSGSQGVFEKKNRVYVNEQLMAILNPANAEAIEIHFYDNFMFENSLYVNWNLQLKPFADYTKTMFVAEGGSLYFSAVYKLGPKKGKFVFMKLKKVTLPDDEEEDKETIQTPTNEAVLIGDDVQVMNSRHQVVRTVKGQEGKFASILSVQKEWFKPTPEADKCDQFQYVNVRNNRFIGWVDGRGVYALLNSSNNFEKNVAGKKVSFTETHNYGMPFADGEGLTGCSVINPTVFSDGLYRGLLLLKLRTIKSDEGDYTVPFKNTKYFELTVDDSATMSVADVVRVGNDYYATINIQYMDDEGRIVYRIYRDQNQYVAEPIEYVLY